MGERRASGRGRTQEDAGHGSQREQPKRRSSNGQRALVPAKPEREKRPTKTQAPGDLEHHGKRAWTLPLAQRDTPMGAEPIDAASARIRPRGSRRRERNRPRTGPGRPCDHDGDEPKRVRNRGLAADCAYGQRHRKDDAEPPDARPACPPQLEPLELDEGPPRGSSDGWLLWRRHGADPSIVDARVGRDAGPTSHGRSALFGRRAGKLSSNVRRVNGLRQRATGCRHWLGIFCVSLACLGSTGLFEPLAEARGVPVAKEAKPVKKLAIHVEGKNATALADQLVAAGPDGMEVLDSAAVEKALRQFGLPAVFGAAIQNKVQRKSLQPNLKKALAKLGADAFLLARETLVGKTHQLYVVYYLKDANAAELDQAVNLGNSDGAQRKAIKLALEETLKSLAPPAPEVLNADTPEPEEEVKLETVAKDETNSTYRAGVAGYEFVRAQLGFQDGGRWFKYSDPISANNTRPYAVFGPPALNVAVEVYPAAQSGLAVIRDLGVSLDYTHHFALKSKTAQNPDGSESAEFDGSWNRFDFGLRYRLRFGADEQPSVLGVSAGYGFQNFVFLPSNATAEKIKLEVPTTRYKYLRLGVDGWLPFGIFAVVPRFSYLAPLGASAPAERIPGPALGGVVAPEPIDDTVYARFRGASVKGIALGIDAAVAIDSGFEVRAGFDYTRFFSAFSPEIGDAFVAGGALDEYLELKLLAGYRH